MTRQYDPRARLPDPRRARYLRADVLTERQRILLEHRTAEHRVGSDQHVADSERVVRVGVTGGVDDL